MTSKDFLYFLLEEDGRSKYEDSNGLISSTVQATPLANTPDGHQDILAGFERDKEDLGTIRSFSFPLKFVKSGAKIIRDTMYKMGLNARLFLLITRREVAFTNSTFSDYHTKFYRGELDLVSCIDNEHTITVNMMETGLAKKIAANKDTKYEFSLTDPRSIGVKMDGMPLKQTANFQINEYNQANNTGRFFVDAGWTTTEGRAPGFAGHSVPYGNITTTSYNYSTGTDYLFDFSQAVNNIRMKGKVLIRREGTVLTNTLFEAYFQTNLGNNIPVIPSMLVPTSQAVTIPFDITFNALQDERFFFLFNTGLDITQEIIISETTFTLDFSSTFRETSTRAFTPAVMLDMLIERIGGFPGRSVTTLLSADPYQNLVLTSGDGLREFPDPKIKISLKEFLQIYRAYAFAGGGVHKEKYEVESLDAFLNPNANIIDLGEVGKCDIVPAKDLLFNKVKVGHKHTTIDDVNGRYMFNTTHTYGTPVDNMNVEKKIESPAIADPYIIEHIRANFDGKSTTDGDSDNEIICLHVEKSTATEQFVANNIASQVFLSGAGQIVMPAQSGSTQLVANSSNTEFQYVGSNTQNVTLSVVINSQKGDNSSSRLRILINGSVFATHDYTANGGTTGTPVYQVTLNPNDVVSVEVAYNGIGVIPVTVNTCILKITLTAIVQYSLFRETYDVLSGVAAGSQVFNIELLSPKRILMLHRRWLNSAVYGLSGRNFNFNITDRNPELKTEKNGVVIEEKADLPITDDIMWLPWYFDIEPIAPLNLVNSLDDDNKQIFRFTWNGVQLKGFLWKAGIAPSDSKPQVYRLLSTPDNDLTDLID